MDPAEAVGRLSHAMDVTDMLVDAPVSEDYCLYVSCALGEGGPNIGGIDAALLARLAAELDTNLEDAESVELLRDTWNANESWPEGEAAPMPWARIPDEAVQRCKEILGVAEPVLAELFTTDHLTSVRRMLADLAAGKTDALLRGRPDVWAASITYAMAQVHHAFNWQGGFMGGIEEKLTPQGLIDAFPTVSKASMTSKATDIRTWLDADGRNRPRYNRVVGALTSMMGPEGRDIGQWLTGPG